jgi:hypothetical protein
MADFLNHSTQVHQNLDYFCDISEKHESDHKKNPSFQTEATDTTPDPSPSHNFESFEFQFEDRKPSVLTPSRFLKPVPEHFICLICKNVVKDPQECLNCENLVCLNCLLQNSNCPHPCNCSDFKKIAKFALKVYETFELSCVNRIFGCCFEGNILKIAEHEKNCLFRVEQCENALCDKFIIRNGTIEEGVPLLCSEICENTIKFSLVVDESDIVGSVENFRALNDRCKKLAELQVREELNQMIRKVEESKRVNEAYRKVKERIEREILARVNSCHPGKWNLKSLKWTCCGNSDVASIGCKQIA